MELESLGPSIPSVLHDENGNVIDSRDPEGEPIQFVFEEITWQQEISWEEALGKLEVAMYPFKKVWDKSSPCSFLKHVLGDYIVLPVLREGLKQ